ncbi:Zn-ribbon domain-containing OB-fold protein [Actinophytocola sediminis]
MDVQPAVVEPDPRPTVRGAGAALEVSGWRCADCGLSTVEPSVRCAGCAGSTEPTSLSPNGIIWSWTVTGIGADRGTAFAYVDLDAGPRVLTRLTEHTPHVVGTRVRVLGTTPSGDLEAGV